MKATTTQDAIDAARYRKLRGIESPFAVVPIERLAVGTELLRHNALDRELDKLIAADLALPGEYK